MASAPPSKDDMSKQEVPVAYPVGSHPGMPVAMGIPVASAPPAYAMPTTAMPEDPLPVGATRHPWHGPGNSYDSGILHTIGCKMDGSWRNPYTSDQVTYPTPLAMNIMASAPLLIGRSRCLSSRYSLRWYELPFTMAP